MNNAEKQRAERIEPKVGDKVGDLLISGRWYCLGFYVDDDHGRVPDFGPIYQFHGVDADGLGIWTDEDRQFVDDIHDPTLAGLMHPAVSQRCHPDAAEFFVLQN